MTQVHQVTPFLHVPDMAQALDFLTRVLRFELKFRAANYAYLEWEHAAVRVLEEPGRERAVPGTSARITVYIDVRDVDALHEELREQLATLAPGDVHGPMDQSYGQRELHVRLPDGHWVGFGQGISAERAEQARLRELEHERMHAEGIEHSH